MANDMITIFNNHLIEFIDDLLLLFPDDRDVWKGKLYVKSMNLVSPSLNIRTWYDYTKPYKDQIDNGDISYFLNAEYSKDAKNCSETSSLLDKVKRTVKELKKENLRKAVQYIQNLTKLSFHYHSV